MKNLKKTLEIGFLYPNMVPYEVLFLFSNHLYNDKDSSYC